jgi:hypothetical protein
MIGATGVPGQNLEGISALEPIPHPSVCCCYFINLLPKIA